MTVKLEYDINKIELPDSSKLNDSIRKFNTFVTDVHQLKQEVREMAETENPELKQITGITELKRSLQAGPKRSVLSESEMIERIATANRFLKEAAPQKFETVRSEYYKYKHSVEELFEPYKAALSLSNVDDTETVANYLRESINDYAYQIEDIASILNKDFDRYSRINCFLAESKLYIDTVAFHEAVTGSTF